MRLFSDLLLVLLATCLSACSTSHPSTREQDAKPDDFAVEYEWREGSLPPPYHYEYTITIRPSGQGEIVLTPDYPRNGVPKWAESFKVREQDLNALYKVMVENGLFTRRWQRVEDRAPVGGAVRL